MTALMPIANLIELIIENWIIVVAVLAVFASVCLGFFKGLKYFVRTMLGLLSVAILGLGAFLIYYFLGNDINGLISFGIAWLPTIIFFIIIILYTLIGVRRGLRKSLILVLHSVLIGALCLGLFFFCVTSTAFDKALLKLINLFMGSGGLQSRLGVSGDCKTLREVLMGYFSNTSVGWGDFGILLGSSSAYVLALVNMAYRLVFAIVFFIIYELLLFIMYLVYLIFYSERKYKKKKTISFAMNKTDISYKKRPVGGGCVGLVRGLVSGIISFSFLGSIFFIAAGGAGASRLPDEISFGENYNQYISIYRSVESYGEQGIFKILNAISNPEDSPYYLFVADIVFSGGLDDAEHDVSGNIKFREELASYNGFAKDTFALLMKYDTEGEIEAILQGRGSGNTMDKILKVCAKHEFRVEFENLIDNFNSQTYIINFALSFADAVIAHIDDVSFMQSVSAENRDLLQVLFRRNYLSDMIPDERERKSVTSKEVTEDIPPYIMVNHLLTKKDAQIVFDIVISILANEIKVSDLRSIANVLVPHIEELSIFSTVRSREMDPVLGRLYCYFDNKYLTDEGEEGIRYSEVKDETVHWSKEIKALLRVADGLLTMYDSLKSGGSNILTVVTDMFDETNENYSRNVAMYEELIDVVSDSVLLSNVLCSQKVHKALSSQLKSINEDIYLPAKISYANRYDKKGNFIAYGEAYYTLRGLRFLAEKENRELIDSISQSSTSFEDLIKKLANTIIRDDPNARGNSLATYLTESTILRSVMSSVIMNNAGDMLIVPTLSLETENSQTINLINKFELRAIFEALPELTDLIIPLASEKISSETVNKILNNNAFNSLLDSGNKIIEATIAKSLIELLADNETIIISKRLEDYEEWVTVNDPGELRKFLKTKDILSLDIEALMNGEGLNGTEIFDKVKVLDEDSITQLLDSEVFYYSSSDMLDKGNLGFEDFHVVVPASSCNILENDNMAKVIKKDEMLSVLVILKDFGLNSGMSSENILRKLIEKKQYLDDSNIISASVVNFIVDNDGICSSLNISQTYMDAGSKEELAEYDATNIWHSELPNLIGAIDEIFGISNLPEDEDFVFNKETVSENTNNLFLSLNSESVTQPNSKSTRLDVCYASEIISQNLTTELDKALNGEDQSDESLIDISVRDSFKVHSRSAVVYSKSEISSFVDALVVFGVDDIDEVNNDRFSSLSQYKNNIEYICVSGIMRGIITKKIDNSLTEDTIDVAVKKRIKGSSATYSAMEISSLVYALDELNIDDVSGLDDYKFSDNMKSFNKPSKNDPDQTCLNVIYRSNIAVGVMTKSVKDTFRNSNLTYTAKAERSDLAVLKEQEVDALVSLLDGRELDNFDVGVISLSRVREQIVPDYNGNPRSYLVLANLTDNIIGNKALYVPQSVYKNKLLTVSEALCFIDAVSALRTENEALDAWNVLSDMVLPAKEDRESVLNSEIMCATFSHTVFTSNSGIAFAQSNIDVARRIEKDGIEGDEIAIIVKAQLEILFDVIESCTGGKELKIPSFSNISSIREHGNNIELLCRFDGTRYSMSKILYPLSSNPGKTENWYIFTNTGDFGTPVAVNVLTAEDILDIIKYSVI